MNKTALHIGLVTHWEDSRWHGINQIVRFTNRFVWYINPENKGYLKEKPLRRSVKGFCEENTCNRYVCECQYPEVHKFLHCVGKVYPINESLPSKTKEKRDKLCVNVHQA